MKIKENRVGENEQIQQRLSVKRPAGNLCAGYKVMSNS